MDELIKRKAKPEEMNAEIGEAVEWWADQLRRTPKLDNGDQSPMGGTTWALAMLNATSVPLVTEEQITKFKESLHARMILHCQDSWNPEQPDWDSYGRSIGVDYGPDRILSDACRDAGIKDADQRFPWKTVMWTNPGRVTVACGYGAEPVTIYPVPEIGKAGQG